MAAYAQTPQYESAAYTTQENTATGKNRPNGARQNSSGSARAPLSSLAPNGKNNGPVNGRLASHSRVEELGQRDGSLVRSGSETDSILDLYKSNTSSANVSQHQTDDIPENMYRPNEDDPEGWIHRDKLAKIESEELQAAGINLAKARRTTSTKSGSRETSARRQRSEERGTSEHRRNEVDEPQRPRLSEPVQEADEDEQATWDLRTPEEIANENASGQMYSNPLLRKSGSKIPVLTSSPMPIPQERIERDTPIARKRTISNSMTPDDSIHMPKTRVRRGSAGSRPLENGDQSLVATPVPTKQIPTPKTNSPTKNKPKTAQDSPLDSGSTRKTSSTTRKASANPKLNGTPTPGARPGTRSGELDRPRTAVNRPEGDPPWLATMYKPDPMLPPEEQIIPTHARKQQQAQWQDSGAVPVTYDRNFSPLAVHTGGGHLKVPSPRINSSTPDLDKEASPIDDGGPAWPLKSVPSVRNSTTGSIRPSTGGSNGGYSTMPRVSNPVQSPRIASPRMGSISSIPAQVPTRMQVQRIQPAPEDEKVKEKSCGCCVVM